MGYGEWSWDEQAVSSPLCLTPVGRECSLIAAAGWLAGWLAGACAHGYPGGFSLADFGASGPLAFFLETILSPREPLSSSSSYSSFINKSLLTSDSPGFPYFTMSPKLTCDVNTRSHENQRKVLHLRSFQCGSEAGTLSH